ncbi:hypothetical protein KEM52_005351 [Ascosphaera acerosa]|nr:hypothetical protein KEM52_005351 [Ascosphaera acerosa]
MALFALDLLGMGRSTRPPFKLPAAARDKEAKTAAAEDWFVDALEEWRQKRNIERFTLMGHSLGGYMAVAYALKYPGRLNKLILASPVGIPEDPYAMQAEMPPSTTKEGSAKSDPPVRKIPKWVAYLWDANVSPFTLVRWAGPLGPRLVSSWTSRRFGHLPPDEASALHDYAYSLFRQRGSGEYALAHVLAPGAFARSPLIRRISGVGRQFLKKNPRPPSVASMLGLGVAAAATTTTTTTTTTTPTATTTPAQTHPAVPSQTAARELPYPVVFMYGSHDWMDAAGGFAAAELVNAERQRALADPSVPDALKKLDRGWAKVELINNAGHHLYLEGWKQFNDVIAREMAEVAEAEQLRRSGTAFGERDGASASGQS